MNNESQNTRPNNGPNGAPKDVPNESLSPLARAFLWVESEAKIKLAILILAGVCALLFVLDFVVHRHSYAPNEGTPGFYALTGFLAFSFIVLGSGALRWLIARSEDYYSPKSVDAEEYPEQDLERRHHGDEFAADDEASDDSRKAQRNAERNRGRKE